MWEQDERESEGVEVRPEEKTSETGVGEVATGPKLFSELGTGITTREVDIPVVEGAGEEAAESEADEGAAPSPPLLTGRRKGGPYRRVVKTQADEGGVTLSGEQRLIGGCRSNRFSLHVVGAARG